MPYANNKGADQPAHPHSLIGAFVVRCIDSLISTLAKFKISRLASVCSWGGRFKSSLVQTPNPKDSFSHDKAEMMLKLTEKSAYRLSYTAHSRGLFLAPISHGNLSGMQEISAFVITWADVLALTVFIRMLGLNLIKYKLYKQNLQRTKVSILGLYGCYSCHIVE